MRHYDRVNYRHLNDSERYRDYEYLADDGWVGPNERVPRGAVNADQPPWSTLDGYTTGPFLGDHAFDERRGQGREYGRDLGLGYGREHDVRQTFERSEGDDYDRGYGRPRGRNERLEYPHEGFDIDERTQHSRSTGEHVGGLRGQLGGVRDGLRDVRDAVRHPRSFVGRMVRGIFQGKGPKNWMRSDQRIHDEVCELLAQHPEIDASEIEVEVKDGEVTLSGSVPDRRTKRLADEVLDDVLGLHDVHNRLRVGGGGDAKSSRQLSGSAGVHTSTAATRR